MASSVTPHSGHFATKLTGRPLTFFTVISERSIKSLDTPRDFRVFKGKTITKAKTFPGRKNRLESLYLYFSDKTYVRLDGYHGGLIGCYVNPKS